MTRRAAAVLAGLLLLAACGSGGSAKPSSSATSTTVPAAGAGEYADAVYDGLLAGTPTRQKDDLRCIARAIVAGIGVDRLRSAGVTVADLRNPNFEPPSTIASAMGIAERVALATRLQSCHIGRIVGSQVALQFARSGGATARPDATQVACFARGFAGAAARRMIAGMMLADLSIPDATRLARLTVGCIGLASLVGNDLGIELSDAETRCIDRVGRTDTTFLRLLADEFRNLQSTPESARTRLGVRVFACLTPAHRVAAARS
jgi:hypothetical protein